MNLSDEQLLIRDTARQFATEVLAPEAGENDTHARFPEDAIRQLGELGFLGMLVPDTFGGSDTDNVSYALALEEIAAGEGAVSTIMSVHNSVGCMPLLKFGNEAQQQKYLPSMASGKSLAAFCLTEPDAGSDAAALRSTASLNGDHYILNGTKQFITSGKRADIAIVFARTAEGKNGISAFILKTDNPGYTVSRLEEKLGQRASETCQITLDNCRVPIDESVLRLKQSAWRVALINMP